MMAGRMWVDDMEMFWREGREDGREAGRWRLEGKGRVRR